MRNVSPVIETLAAPAPVRRKESDPGVHPLVEITWVDIVKYSGWEPHEEVELPVFKSLGWLVYEDDFVIKIADTLDEEDTGFGIMAIPKGVEISRRVVEA